MKLQELRNLIRSEVRKMVNEQESWSEFDKRMATRDAQDKKKASAFVRTPRGKNAVMVIGKLINKPYKTNDLDDVLQKLNLDKQEFMYAAKAAGMDFATDGGSIRIFDKNYRNKDVSIQHMKDKWYVG
jgi:hypothetical protein